MKIKNRIETENRTQLQNVIPLDTPYILYVDPSGVCNFRCSFCYQSDNEKYKAIKGANTLMKFNTFEKIVEQSVKFNTQYKVLRMYAHGEPLLNKDFSKMVKYAKSWGIADRIDTTTNGSLFIPETSEAVINSGIDRINISIEAVSESKYLSIANYHIIFDEFIRNLEYLYHIRNNCQIFIKTNGDVLSDEERKMFLSIFTPISDGIAIEHTMKCWDDFEVKGTEVNTEIGVYGQTLDKEVQVCPYIFYNMVVQSNGDVSACFLDWNKKLIIGNINEHTLPEIWNGKRMNMLRRIMLKGCRATINSCKNCGQLISGMPDDIDKYADDLLKLF